MIKTIALALYAGGMGVIGLACFRKWWRNRK